MDKHEEKQSIFNWRLAKFVGLFQILNPNAIKILGVNVYYILIWINVLQVIAVSLLFPFGLYYLKNDITALVYYVGVITNILFGCYKIINMMNFSKDLWMCIDITSFNFMMYKHYDMNILKKWQKVSLRLTYLIFITVTIVFLVWSLCPFYITKNIVAKTKNIDGSYSEYRLNIVNLYFMVSDNTYNEYFYIFYLIEVLIVASFLYFTTLFDTFMIMLCLAISCQLETIFHAMASLGHKKSSKIINLGTFNFIR